MAYHNDLGARGEQMAVDWLQSNGYTILARNFRFQKAEIDIIAQKEMIVVVEVKTRNSEFFGDPQSFVTPAKIKLLVMAADEYLNRHQIDEEVRFDIIAILSNQYETKLTHIEDAFYHF